MPLQKRKRGCLRATGYRISGSLRLTALMPEPVSRVYTVRLYTSAVSLVPRCQINCVSLVTRLNGTTNRGALLKMCWVHWIRCDEILNYNGNLRSLLLFHLLCLLP